MKIQKPTVLDAARLAAEIARYRGAFIEQILTGKTHSRLYLILKKPSAILKFIVDRGFACIAEVKSLPDDLEKSGKPLIGYSLTDVHHLGDDRIVALELLREDRLGRSQRGNLILEIIPTKGDAVLTDESGTIKWSLNKNNTGQYHLPPKLKKATALNFDIEKLLSTIDRPELISTEIYGFNARDLLNLRFDRFDNIEPALQELRNYAIKASNPGHAWVISKDDEVIGYSLLSPVLQPGESIKEFDSALEMYEAYYSQAIEQSFMQDRLESLKKILNKEIARERAKVNSIQLGLENAAAAQTYRRYGELILANIDSINKGARVAHLLDFESGARIEIKLDPAKPAAANAEEYFKRAKKAASSLNVLSKRIEHARNKIEQLEQIRSNSSDDITALESSLIKLNLLGENTRSPKKKIVERRLPYKRFRASSGWEIWVGRRNTDNDELTFKIAHKDDYWFHAWQAAGSHTILRLPNKQAIPEKQTLLEAAALAAYFSKARTSSKVPVAYTQVKFVHKPKKFAPGKVLVDKEKQLMVRPADPEMFTIKEDL